MLPSDTGSRIGMIYVQNPNDNNKAEMHFIVNGEDQGPCTKDIPYKESELYAVIDVYGTTKQVKIIQLYESKFIFFNSFSGVTFEKKYFFCHFSCIIAELML